jgi:hypothetical protein
MVRIEMNATNPNTGQRISLPPEVTEFVQRGTAVLQKQLASADSTDISAVWEQFENHGKDGWSVGLKLDYEGHSFSRQLWIDRLYDTRSQKEAIRDLVGEFGHRLSEQAKIDLRELRHELTLLNMGRE